MNKEIERDLELIVAAQEVEEFLDELDFKLAERPTEPGDR